MGNSRQLLEDDVRFCYLDESGTGDHPVATMVGVVVNSSRMRPTKADWQSLLKVLSDIAKRPIVELHASDFYSGNGVWRQFEGPIRALATDEILRWLAERKHRVVYAAALSSSYDAARKAGTIPPELNTIWQVIAFHSVLAMQKYSKPEKNNRGQTLFQFDDNSAEKGRFLDLVCSPPEWSDIYYEKSKKQEQLDQMIDIPNFCDSKRLPLIQVADFLAFFLRRYAELKEGFDDEEYPGEQARVAGWAAQIADRTIGGAHIYPKKQRNDAQALFYDLAPPSIRNL